MPLNMMPHGHETGWPRDSDPMINTHQLNAQLRQLTADYEHLLRDCQKALRDGRMKQREEMYYRIQRVLDGEHVPETANNGSE